MMTVSGEERLFGLVEAGGVPRRHGGIDGVGGNTGRRRGRSEAGGSATGAKWGSGVWATDRQERNHYVCMASAGLPSEGEGGGAFMRRMLQDKGDGIRRKGGIGRSLTSADSQRDAWLAG